MPIADIVRIAMFCGALFAVVACGDGRAPITETGVEAPTVEFVDVAATAGLDFVHHNGFSGEYFYVETAGSGGGFIDYDGDGWLDVYLVNGAQLIGRPLEHPPVNHLFRNESGQFDDVTAGSGAGDASYGTGCVAADYDNDGDQDLYVSNFGANVLLQNQQGEGFRDVTTQAGVGESRWSTAAGFFDYDGDGDLDLMVVNYLDFTLDNNIVCKQGPHRSYCDPLQYNPVGDVLYRNDGEASDGDPNFMDVSDGAGITLEGRGLGIAFSDYDDDGDTDVYVANDKDMNFLYENRQGHFAEVGLQAGTRYNADGLAEAGMGVDFGDVDNDGDADLYVSNFSYETNTLYANDGRGEFRDATEAFDLAAASYMPLGFGLRFMDYDHDGYLDLFVANGHVLDNIERIRPELRYPQSNQMMRNLRGRGFMDVSASLGAPFAHAAVSRAAAVGDYDNDGDLDILVTNIADRPNLLRNEGGNRMPLGFGLRFMDYDHDGYLDLFVANGHVLDNIERIRPELRYPQSNQMMRNLRGRGFMDVSASLGAPFAHAAVSRAAAVGDYDNDGDLDILVTNIADRPNLLRNEGGNRGNWLIVELTGAVHGDAMGARVMVTTDGRRQLRERQTGGSYLSTHDPRLHFGLGGAARADIEITWPGGQIQVIDDVQANQILRVHQQFEPSSPRQ